MWKKVSSLIFITLLINNTIISQEIIQPSEIKWYTLNQALELAKKEPRPILLDVYTDWCTWCHHMMKTTFANKGIANYINTYFYAARFNAESTDTIEYNGNKYFNRKIGRRPANDLANFLLDGKLSYPSLVYFDRQGRKTVVPGFMESKDIEPILVYFAENLGNNVPLNNFTVNFMYTFPEQFEKDHSIFKVDNSLKPDTLGMINWVNAKDVINLSKKKKKPIMMYFYTDWSISSKVMEKTSFKNRELAEKINANYYLVKINAADTSEINFLGKKYTGTGVNLPNQITYQFLQQNFQMPAIVIFDENYNVLARLNGYLVKQQLLPLTEYFYDKSYKKLSFQEYLKTYVSGKQQTNEISIN